MTNSGRGDLRDTESEVKYNELVITLGYEVLGVEVECSILGFRIWGLEFRI